MQTIAERAAMLGIYLAPTPNEEIRVGSLVRDVSGGVTFNVDDAYLYLGPPRPILSMAWRGVDEEDMVRRLTQREDKVTRHGYIPPYFAGLLPEGALRELVESEFGTGAFDDFDVLARLGGDLPGAVVARLEAGLAGATAAPARVAERKTPLPPDGVKFSLAGIQLKFGVLESDRGVTVPAPGEGGDIILKVPSERHPGLVEAEYAGLELACAAGVRTAKAFLVDTDKIQGIPAEFLGHEGRALAVRRFDRDGRRRIHTEDFAQIVGAVGER